MSPFLFFVTCRHFLALLFFKNIWSKSVSDNINSWSACEYIVVAGVSGSHSLWMPCFPTWFVTLDSKLFGKNVGGIIWDSGWLHIPLKRISVTSARPLGRYQSRINLSLSFIFVVTKWPKRPGTKTGLLLVQTYYEGITLWDLLSKTLYRAYKILTFVNLGLFFMLSPPPPPPAQKPTMLLKPQFSFLAAISIGQKTLGQTGFAFQASLLLIAFS